jgi:hypothetical protein
MNTEIGENINIDDILNIINETLDSKNYLSSSIVPKASKKPMAKF